MLSEFLDGTDAFWASWCFRSENWCFLRGGDGVLVFTSWVGVCVRGLLLL